MRRIGPAAAAAIFLLTIAPGCGGPTLGPLPLHTSYTDPDATSGTYLVPNFRDSDGTEAYVHFTPSQMPVRVLVRTPIEAPSNGSPDDARRAAKAGVLLWERALELELPWFDVEFTEDVDEANVLIAWTLSMAGANTSRTHCSLRSKDALDVFCVVELVIARASRPTDVHGSLSLGGLGSLGGYGGGGGAAGSGIPRVRGPGAVEERQSKQTLESLAAHEFGHVLGLGHCDCDSIMGHADSRETRPEIRDVDRNTLTELWAIPNGTRVDGGRVGVLEEREGP